MEDQVPMVPEGSTAMSSGLVDLIGEGAIHLDHDFRIVEINAEALRIDGRPAAEILGRTHWEVWPASVGTPVEDAYRRAMIERVPVDLQHHYIDEAAGQDCWLELRIYPTEGGVVSLYRDITDRKEAELERDRVVALMETFVEAVPGVVYAKGRAGRMLLGNKGTTDLIGKPPEEYIGKTDAEFLDDAAQAASVMATDERLMSAGVAEQVEEEVSFPDGRRAVWLSTKAPLRSADGEVIGLIGSSVDITERKVAEAKLAEAEERFRFALEAAGGIGTWDWDIAQDRVATSAQFARLYGLDPDRAAAGLPVSEYVAGIHPDDRAEVNRLIEEAVKSGGDYRAEYRIRGADGGVRWVIARGRCLAGPNGKAARFPGVTFDITERKRAELELRETSQRLDAILANTREAVFLLDEHQLCVYANASAEQLTGYSTSDLCGQQLHALVHHSRPDGSPFPVDECPISCASPGRSQVSGEEMFIAPDGSFYPIAFTASPVVDDQGRAIGTVIEARHIGQEKAREAALARRTGQLQALAETALAVARAPSLEETLDVVTQAARRIIGAHQGVVSLTRGPDWSQSINSVALTDKYAAWREYDALPDGSGIYAWLCEQNKPARFTQAELEAHPRWTGFGTHANGHPPMRGWLAAPLVGRDGRNLGLIQLSDKEDRSEFDEADEAMLVQLAQLASAAVEQAQAEAVLAKQASEFEALIENVSQLAWMAEPDGHIYWYNKRWYDYTGTTLKEMLGWGWRDVHHPEHVDRILQEVREHWARGEPWEGTYLLRGKDGIFRPFLTRAEPIRDEDGNLVRWFGTNTDIAGQLEAEERLRELNDNLERRVQQEVKERTRAEEALRQAQKMEAVGQLTGGIAHDFNNLLTVVVGNIDMGLRALDAGTGDPRVKRAMENAQKGAERAASLTQRLLAFSRRQPLAPKPIDVDRLVTGMSDLLSRSLGETVRLEIVTSPGLWRVEADPNQLESALLNLAVNARDAMPVGGTLTIETANARLDENYAAAHAEVAPGQYVVIAVTDTGQGIPKHMLDKVFEPFFTTKEVGKGTGLGLSMVYGFTKQSGGHVKIYSEEGRGSTIKIYLPRLMKDGSEEERSELTPGLEVSRRAETILVVEDDDDVRAYTVECLRELGYRVLEAHDGPSAMRLLERQEGPLDLLFTDVVMPGMSGRELADAAREVQPNLKVLYTSGYTRNAIVHGGRLDAGVEMIAKPFTYQALATKVRDMLDAGATRRILVIEDEPTVRALAMEVLQSNGFVAEEAANAAEAMNKVRAAQGRYDAIMIDAGLPDKNGGDLAAELRALHADLPLLLASGEHEGELRERFSQDRCVRVIGKPYTGGKLAQALRELSVRCSSAS